MRYRLQRHDGTDCSATMVPITVLRMVPIQRYRHLRSNDGKLIDNFAFHIKKACETKPEDFYFTCFLY